MEIAKQANQQQKKGARDGKKIHDLEPVGTRIYSAEVVPVCSEVLTVLIMHFQDTFIYAFWGCLPNTRTELQVSLPSVVLCLSQSLSLH